MPIYEFICQKCGNQFTLTLTLREREEKKPRCPKCKSVKLETVYGIFFAKTSKKS